MRDRYGRNKFGQSVLLARRLVEAGVSLVQVNWPRFETFPNFGVWDTHAKNEESLRTLLMPIMDQAYSALLDDLSSCGLLDKHVGSAFNSRRLEVEMDSQVSKDFRKQVLGYGLTTAEIVYRRPDHHWLLQTYVWQDYDMFPDFPVLKDFLAFWKRSLDGPLCVVTVAHSKLIKPAELHAIDGVIRLH